MFSTIRISQEKKKINKDLIFVFHMLLELDKDIMYYVMNFKCYLGKTFVLYH